MAELDYNPLNVVPYKQDQLQALIDRGLPEFQSELKRWFRRFSMFTHPDKLGSESDEIKRRSEEWFKLYNKAYDAISKADEATIREWVKTQHSGLGADDALLAAAAAEIESLESRLNSALTALNNGRPISREELLRYADPRYAGRTEELERRVRELGDQNRDLGQRARDAQGQATDYRIRAETAERQATEYERRATTAERNARDYQVRVETAERRTESSELARADFKAKYEEANRTAAQRGERVSQLETKLKEEIDRARLLGSRLETAEGNLGHADEYAKGIFAQLQEAQGQLREYEGQLRKFATGEDISLGGLAQVGAYLRKGKQYDLARAAFQLVIERDPNNADAYANIGAIYRDTGDRSQAIDNFRKALEINPNHKFSRDNADRILADAFKEGVRLLRESKMYEAAINAFRFVSEKDPEGPNNVDLYVNTGIAYRDWFNQSKNPAHREQALQYFQRALEINPNHRFADTQVKNLSK